MKSFAFAFLLMLGGCDTIDGWRNPEVAACETFIKEGLASPSSYDRVKFLTGNDAISKNDYAYGEGWTPKSPFFEFAKRKAIDPSIRAVSIEYGAANAYGTPIRSFGYCEFLMSNAASGDFGDEPSKAANSIIRMNAVAALAPGLTEQQRTQKPCCLKPSLQSRRKVAD